MPTVATDAITLKKMTCKIYSDKGFSYQFTLTIWLLQQFFDATWMYNMQKTDALGVCKFCDDWRGANYAQYQMCAKYTEISPARIKIWILKTGRYFPKNRQESLHKWPFCSTVIKNCSWILVNFDLSISSTEDTENNAFLVFAEFTKLQQRKN